MKKIFTVVLVVAFLFAHTPHTHAAEDDVGNEMSAIASFYSAYINDYIATYTDNPVVIEALLNLLAQLTAMQNQINGGATPSRTPGGEVVTPTNPATDIYKLWPELWFGTESTITSIEVYTSNYGNSRIVWHSDDNERVESIIRKLSDRTGTLYESGYDYYKDDELESSERNTDSTYGDLVFYTQDLLSETSMEGEGDWLIEFLIDNPRIYRYSSFSPAPPSSVDCHYNASKDKADEIFEAALVKEERNFQTPVSDITEYYSPSVMAGERESAGCATASAGLPIIYSGP